LSELVGKADSMGLQAIVHAIGDRAVEQAAEALSIVTGHRNPRKHRIEHASLLPKDLRAKVKKFGIRLAVQPSFIVSDTWAEKRLGEERVVDLYPLKSILSGGIVASGGSDSPVETMNPVLGMWASMSRSRSPEALTMGDALELYTRHAADNGLDVPGALREGDEANLTLLDSDIRRMHPALFRRVAVAATIAGGRITYSSFE
jgi:hypothetical protein